MFPFDIDDLGMRKLPATAAQDLLGPRSWRTKDLKNRDATE
jgi:hypothetical protein